MQQGIVTKAKSKPRNLLRGLTPSQDTWDTPPSDLANATDGSFTTVTGVGTKVLGGAGTVGQLIYDLGASKTVIVGGKVDLYASTGSSNILLDVSEDNVTYISGPGYIYSVTKTGADPRFIQYPFIVSGRYLRFRFTAGGAANPGSVKIYQLTAYEVGV